MKFPGAKRRPPFVTLPRHKRSHEVIRLKGKMRRDAAEYGGRFTSRLVLNEPGRPDLYNQWFDFYFPGTDRFTIWNASFVTARKAFWDEAHDIAHTRVAAMLSPEEREENSKLEFVPAQRSSTGKILTYKLAEREKMRFEQFGGLTFHEQWRKLEAEIARNEPPVIHESVKLDRSYVYGIGLKIVLDVDVINQASIEAAIDRFIAVGETDWVSPETVPRDRLPVVSEHEALATVTFPAEQISMSEMSHLNMNMSAVRPPIAFAAKNARFVSNFPQGSDELWMADLKACRHDVQCEVFEDILFVESNGTAFVYGIEFEDGYPKGLKPDLALKQQSFIQFLRYETRRDNDAIGLAALIFTGHEYSTEGKATAAYIAARNTSLAMGVGYRNNDGKYELIGIDPEEDSWLESARSILPFDELCHPG